MNIREAEVLEVLSEAARAVMRAKKHTNNGLVDDHCVNILSELRAAMLLIIEDTAEEM